MTNQIGPSMERAATEEVEKITQKPATFEVGGPSKLAGLGKKG